MWIHDATEQAFKNCYEKGYEAGKKVATDNNVVGKWIPVSERLPERKQDVIVYAGRAFNPSVYEYHFLNKDYGSFQNITHWMPMPEPPKEDE